MANTVDNAFQNLFDDANTRKRSKLFLVPTGGGNWLTLNMDADRKYLFRSMAFDNTGASSTDKIKALYGSTEPDVTVFSGEADVEWMSAGDVFYPIRSVQQVSLKAVAGTGIVLLVRVIERSVAGHEG